MEHGDRDDFVADKIEEGVARCDPGGGGRRQTRADAGRARGVKIWTGVRMIFA